MKLRFYISFLFAFFIYISALKAQITLISPKNNTVTTNPITRFTWNTTNYAAQYVFQISTTEDFSSIIYSTSVNAGFIDYTLPLPTENRNFFWRVRKSNMVEWTEFSKITLISLVNFSSIKGWYAADSNVIKDISNNVENWQDISVNANNVLQSNQTEKPTFIPTRQIINNKPTIKFTSDLSQIKTLNFSNQLALTDFTMLLVRNHVPSDFAAQYVVAGVDNGILSEINALNAGFGHYRFTQYRFSNTASVNQQFSIYTHKNNLIRRNGIESSLAYGSITPSLLLDKIGTRTDFPNAAFKGELAELIIFNGSIPLDSLEVLEQYLRFKYAPPVNLGKDTIFGNSFCDTMRLYAGNNFSSYLWSTGETTESIKATSDKNYSVLVRDIFGYESSDNITVLPYKKLSGKTVYLCKGDTLKLNLGLPVGFNAQWSNGVNSSSISLSQEGVYSVLITDSKGCKFNDTIKIILNQYNYSPELISQQLTICEGEKLFLLSNIPIDSIRWSTGSTQDFTTFTSSGSQNVYAKTITGCIIKDTFVVNVAGKAPVAKFGYSPVCQNSEVNFLDSSIAPLGNSITSWKWNFSNNVSSSIQNPMTTFTNLGIATASLKVVTNSGCTDSIAKTIVVNRKPSPSFYNLLSCAGVATTFVDQSVANAAAITNWNWDFAGLGTVNGIQNPLFEFPSSGVYGVKLTATNSNSCSDTVTILTRVNASPVSNFSFDSVCGKTAVTLKFLATVESPSVIPDINWGSWDFGDGSIETAIRNPQHVYDTPGSYDVSLIVRSSDQCIDTVVKRIKVFDFPLVDFTVSQTQCAGKEIQFTDISVTSDGTPLTKWNWFFSGQATSEEQNPRYAFNAQGNYTVQLTARNAVGCTGTKLRSVAISAPPTPAFTFSPQNGLPPLTVNYFNQSPVNGNYLWDYGDGSPLVEGYNPPVHIYTEKGTFPIKLIATDFRGCTDTLTKLILVDKAFLDGVMASVSIIPNGEFYKIQVSVINNSNVEITALGLSLQLGGGAVIRENWTGSLLPGQTTVYLFTGEIKIGDNGQIPVICASIDNINNNAAEDRTDNNTSCKEVAVGSFDVLSVYPNPAYEVINFGVMLPKEGRVNIRFIDILGQQMYSKDFDGLKGYNSLSISTMQLNAAVYVAEVSYDGQVVRKKFMRKDRK